MAWRRGAYDLLVVVLRGIHAPGCAWRDFGPTETPGQAVLSLALHEFTVLGTACVHPRTRAGRRRQGPAITGKAVFEVLLELLDGSQDRFCEERAGVVQREDHVC